MKPLLPLPPDLGCDVTVAVDWSVLEGVLVADWSSSTLVSSGTSDKWLWSITALWSEIQKESVRLGGGGWGGGQHYIYVQFEIVVRMLVESIAAAVYWDIMSAHAHLFNQDNFAYFSSMLILQRLFPLDY